MSTEPPSERGGGSTILLLAILLLIAAGLVYWAWSAHSPHRPQPSASGVPPTAPAKALPTSR